MKNKIVLHIPHSSLKLTREFVNVEKLLTKKEVQKFNLQMTDLYTHELFKSLSCPIIKAKYSRICCDVEKFSDDEKECWGNPAIIVNCGYRCDALNEAVKGSKTSAHTIGAAADIEPKNQRNKEFLGFLEQYLLDNHIPFDQLVSEKPDKNGVPSWIHIGLKNRQGKQRRMVFTIK